MSTTSRWPAPSSTALWCTARAQLWRADARPPDPARRHGERHEWPTWRRCNNNRPQVDAFKEIVYRQLDRVYGLDREQELPDVELQVAGREIPGRDRPTSIPRAGPSRGGWMIHKLLLSLDKALPLSPPLVAGRPVSSSPLWPYTLRPVEENGLLLRCCVLLTVAWRGSLWPGQASRRPRPVGDLEVLAEGVIGPCAFRCWSRSPPPVSCWPEACCTPCTTCLPVSAGRAVAAAAGAGRGAGQSVGQRPPVPAKVVPALDQARPARLDSSGPVLGSEGSAAWDTPLPQRRGHRPGRGRLWASGFGKTQCAVLPAIADRMRRGTAWSSPTCRASCSPTSSGSPP